jgi:c-di-GMP-binding flagellar brake protein YcgR
MERVQNRVLQDRRRLSRISVQMECRFKSEGNEYGALLLDLSQGGALLSSTLLSPHDSFASEEHPSFNPSFNKDENLPSNKDENLPAEESKISITLESGNLKSPMTLSGTIRRSSIGMSEYGKVAQFGVEFENTPLELLRLISRLSMRRKVSRIPTQMQCRYRRLDSEEYEARILDLSTEGALLSASVVPAEKSKVFIIIEAQNMGAPLMLKGTVTRSSEAAILGEDGQFGVEFDTTPPELRAFINAMPSN